MDNIEKKGGSFNFLCSSVDIGYYQGVLNVQEDDCISFEDDKVEYSLREKLESVSDDLCF